MNLELKAHVKPWISFMGGPEELIKKYRGAVKNARAISSYKNSRNNFK